jgi:hypothetical protein
MVMMVTGDSQANCNVVREGSCSTVLSSTSGPERQVVSLPESHKPMVAQEERRRYPRYNVRIPVQLQPEGAAEPLHLDTTDLSRNGCCVAIAHPLSVGTRVAVVLSFPENQARVRGCVITRHPQFGNGIMFLRFEEDGEEHLRKYLNSIRGE